MGSLDETRAPHRLPAHRGTLYPGTGWELECLPPRRPHQKLTHPTPSPWFRHSFCGQTARMLRLDQARGHPGHASSFSVPMIQDGQPELQLKLLLVSSAKCTPWTPEGLSAELLPARGLPAPSIGWRLWLPRCRTWLFPVLNFVRFPFPHFCSLSGPW